MSLIEKDKLFKEAAALHRASCKILNRLPADGNILGAMGLRIDLSEAEERIANTRHLLKEAGR